MWRARLGMVREEVTPDRQGRELSLGLRIDIRPRDLDPFGIEFTRAASRAGRALSGSVLGVSR